MALLKHGGNDVIMADTLGSTTTAGVSAVLVGVAGVLPSIIDVIGGTDVPELVQLGGLVLIGLAVLAWAIATAGDALARAYATAHVKTATSTPALADAVNTFAINYRDAAFGIDAANGSEARKPAFAQAIERFAEAHENASLGTSIDLPSVPERTPPLAEAIKALAAAHRDAAVDSMTDQHGVNGQRCAVAVARSSAAPSAVEPKLLPVAHGIEVTVEGQKHRVLGTMLMGHDAASGRLLIIDDSGNTRLLGTA